MYRFVGKLSTGFELHRGRRNSSVLAGQHLHYLVSQHPAANNSGLITTSVRSLLFGLNWNVRAHAAAGLLPDTGHSWVWLFDALLDVVQVNNLQKSRVPSLFRSRQRTNTNTTPTLTWGVQFKALGLDGNGALPYSL